MADFYSTTTATATRLRGINEKAQADKARAVDNYSKTAEAEIQLLEALEQLEERADAISERVATLRGFFLEHARNLTERIAAFEQDCDDAKVRFVETLGVVRAASQACQDATTTAQSQCQSLSSEVVAEWAARETEIESTSDEFGSQMDIAVSEIDDTLSTVRNKLSELSTSAEELASAITGEITTELGEVHDKAVESLQEMQGEFNDRLEEVEKVFGETATEQLGNLDDEIEELLDKLEQAANRVATTFEKIGETATTTCDTIETTQDAMSTATNSSTIGLRTAIKILDHFKELFERI